MKYDLPDDHGRDDKFEYFMLRLTRSMLDPGRVTGLIEQLGLGEKRRTFHRSVRESPEASMWRNTVGLMVSLAFMLTPAVAEAQVPRRGAPPAVTPPPGVTLTERERETVTACTPMTVSAPGYVDVVINDYLKAVQVP